MKKEWSYKDYIIKLQYSSMYDGEVYYIYKKTMFGNLYVNTFFSLNTCKKCIDEITA